MSHPEQATVHDLGYKRYNGNRYPQHTRYRVIARNLVSMAWKGWWRYKLSLVSANSILLSIAVAIYFSRDQRFQAAQVGSEIQSIADSLIPQSFEYLGLAALTLNLTVLAGAVSRDLQAGAFEFYFSRPVRPIDYLVGKVVGAIILLAPILLLAPLILTIYRVALTAEGDQIIDKLPWIYKAFIVGSIATFTHACVALAFGALLKKPKYAVVGYAAFILVFGGFITGLSHGLHIPWLGALNLHSAITGLASGIFGVQFLFGPSSPSLLASTLSIGGYCIVSLTILFLRVNQAKRAGIGGG